MPWEIKYTDQFESWWNDLEEKVQEAITRKVTLLEEFGPNLPRPHSDTIHGGKYPNMKELRAKSKGVYRIFYAFDPRQSAILLIGGNKKGRNQRLFYQEMTTTAEQIYEQYLKEIEDEEKQK